MRIWWYPLVRDGFWYLLSLLCLLGTVADEEVALWESCVLFGIYLLYCLNMRLNAWFMKKFHIIDPHKPVADEDDGIEEISFGHQVIEVRAMGDSDLQAGAQGEDPAENRSGSKGSAHSSRHGSHGGSRSNSKQSRGRGAHNDYGEHSDYAGTHRSGHGGHGFDDHRDHSSGPHAEPHSFGRSLGEASDLHSSPSKSPHGGPPRSRSPHGGARSPHGGPPRSPHGRANSNSPPRSHLAIADGSQQESGHFGTPKHEFNPRGRDQSKSSAPSGPSNRADQHHSGDLRAAGGAATSPPNAPNLAAEAAPVAGPDPGSAAANTKANQQAPQSKEPQPKAKEQKEPKPFHRRERRDETEDHDGFAYFARDPLVTLWGACMPDPTASFGRMLAVFLMSLAFIFLLSYVMMDSADRVGCVLKIPRFVMGLVVLAAGTSVPHALRAHTVAKEGESAELVAHVLSHNVFIVSAGLGLPWLLHSAAHNGDPIVFPGEREELIEGVVFALVTFLLFIGFLAVNKWRLSHKLGKLLIAIYCVYLFFIFIMLAAGVKVDNDHF